MPSLVADNLYTAQSALADAANPGGQGGRPPNSGFGRSTVYMPNVDRVYMTPIDGTFGYENSSWSYDIDNRQWTRKRPNPGAGIQADLNNIHDYFGPAWGDNQMVVYNPDTGTVWRWGGNFGDNSNPGSQIDGAWFFYGNSVNTPAGVYIYEPVGNTWTKPGTTGMQSDSNARFLSSGCGWDPTISKFLQVLGEKGNGGMPCVVGEIDPSTGPGGTYTAFSFAGDGVTSPVGRNNISYQFVYHTRAKKWILFGGCFSNYTQYFSDTWMYDAPTRTWTNLNPTGSPPARAFGLMWYDSNNNVILITAGESPPGHIMRTDTWEYSLEYNTWKLHPGVFDRGCANGTPGNNSGGVIFDATRNIAVFTPPIGTATGRDVYTFRYAIPRLTATKNQWYGIKMPTNWAVGIAHSDKHATIAYSPVHRRCYVNGGDFYGQGSYLQFTHSLDLLARFADPTNLTAGWVLEHDKCALTSEAIPKKPDFVGWTWDPSRNKFWFVPGEQVPGTVNDCSGETGAFGDDPQYYYHHHMLFDPATKRWSDVVLNPSIDFPGNEGPWMSVVDPIRQKIIRLEHNSPTFRIEEFDINPASAGYLTWTKFNASGATMSSTGIQKQPWTFDPTRRVIYGGNRFNMGFVKIDYVAHTAISLGTLPGTSFGGPEDNAYMCFDWNARMLYYVERRTGANPLGGSDIAGRVWRWDVDATSPTWVEITALPMVSGGGEAIPNIPYDPARPDPNLGSDDSIPHATSLCFDPDNNGVWFFGAKQEGTLYYADQYSYFLRGIDMGAGSVSGDTTPPTVTITSPTSDPTYPTDLSSIVLGGSATDNVGVTSVVWQNQTTGTNGSATGTTSWTTSAISLNDGPNVLIVTAFDAAGNSGTDTITVTLSVGTGARGPGIFQIRWQVWG